jgi:C1A family cysteine protease
MLQSLIDFAARMPHKPIAEKEKLARYQPSSSGGYELEIGGEMVQLCSRAILAPPNADDIEAAITSPPLWDIANDKPAAPAAEGRWSNKDNQTPVKHQLTRATCVSFAAIAQMEAKIKADGGPEVDLSEQFAHWRLMNVRGMDQCQERALVLDAARFLENFGVCTEQFCNYKNREYVEQHCGETPSQDAITQAAYKIVNPRKFYKSPAASSITNTDYIESLVRQRYDMVVGMEMAFIEPDENGIYDAWLDTSRRPVRIGHSDESSSDAPGHAMLLVGYDKERVQDKPFFIMKNSWGPNQGDDGYFYVSYDYFICYAKVGYIIEDVTVPPSD